MLNVFAVVELLLTKLVSRYTNEVDLVAYYGSHAQGRATSSSDLDIFYVPAEGKNPPVGRTVLVDGILFDLWPIRWDTLEGFATGRLRGWSLAPSLVYHAKVLYKRSDDAEKRLNTLKQVVADLQKPEARAHMIRRSLDEFSSVLAHLGNLRLAVTEGNLTDVRNAGFGVLVSVFECLALANQALFDQGYNSIITQASRLSIKPANFENIARVVAVSSSCEEIMAAAERIALETRSILRQYQQSMPAQKPIAAQFNGAYPEIRDGLRKVTSACAKQRDLEAYIAAWNQQITLAQMLADLQSEIGSHSGFNLYSEYSGTYEELSFPNLIGGEIGNLPKLAERTKGLENKLTQWLGDHAVDLQVYSSIDDFAQSLDM